MSTDVCANTWQHYALMAAEGWVKEDFVQCLQSDRHAENIGTLKKHSSSKR